MNHFHKDRLPPARSVYEADGFRLGRVNSQGWAIAKGQPPCHKSKSGRSFSINVNHGGFVCFGCGSKGDLVAYVRMRDGLSFQQACQRLNAWDEAPSPETVRQFHAKDQERRRQREAAAAEQRERQQRLIRLRDQLHSAGRDYWQTAQRLSELRQGATPDWPTEEEACWSHLSVTIEDLRELEGCYCAAAGLEHE